MLLSLFSFLQPSQSRPEEIIPPSILHLPFFFPLNLPLIQTFFIYRGLVTFCFPHNLKGEDGRPDGLTRPLITTRGCGNNFMTCGWTCGDPVTFRGLFSVWRQNICARQSNVYHNFCIPSRTADPAADCPLFFSLPCFVKIKKLTEKERAFFPILPPISTHKESNFQL